MKNKKAFLAILLALVMSISFALQVMADNTKNKPDDIPIDIQSINKTYFYTTIISGGSWSSYTFDNGGDLLQPNHSKVNVYVKLADPLDAECSAYVYSTDGTYETPIQYGTGKTPFTFDLYQDAYGTPKKDYIVVIQNEDFHSIVLTFTITSSN